MLSSGYLIYNIWFGETFDYTSHITDILILIALFLIGEEALTLNNSYLKVIFGIIIAWILSKIIIEALQSMSKS